MIVLDASVAVDLLIKPAAETRELRARIRAAGIVYAPHRMDAEVTNTLRRHLLCGQIDQVSARGGPSGDSRACRYGGGRTGPCSGGRWPCTTS
jgi:hypothetical protein